MATRVDDDLYGQLGVARSASPEEITAAFREHARLLHPDARPDDADAAERFKELSHAYAVLTDRDRRAEHDRRLSIREAPGRPVAARPPVPTRRPIFGTPHRARLALWGGLGIVVLGIAAAVLLGTSDTGDAAKTVTLWIVAAKLLICGAILAGVGAWRLATPTSLPTHG